MRKKILWISQLIMAVVLLIYAVLSTQVFYNNLIAGTEKNLKVYMNLFDIKEYTLDEEGADRFSAELSGLRVTFLNVSGDVLADSEKRNWAIMRTGRKFASRSRRAKAIPCAAAARWAKI